MVKLIFLGSSNAIPDEHHDNTHMAIRGEKKFLLIDCVNNPILRLSHAGLDPEKLSDMVLTHFHPDHVSGVPLLLMNMWLMGRHRPINIYGLHHTLDRIENLMNSYEWGHWPNFFPVAFHRLPQEEMTLVLENDEFRIFASPVRHLIPTIGLRVEDLKTGKSIAYSCDTEPCPQVVRLAEDVDILVHEATGASPGHSSASQAAGIASEAKAKSLYLIHYQTCKHDPEVLVTEASQVYPGPVQLAKDFMELEF
ncbi:MAG: MBL fold metallo-hydrolase [Omnitrophica WOR_2 bacterium]